MKMAAIGGGCGEEGGRFGVRKKLWRDSAAATNSAIFVDQ